MTSFPLSLGCVIDMMRQVTAKSVYVKNVKLKRRRRYVEFYKKWKYVTFLQGLNMTGVFTEVPFCNSAEVEILYGSYLLSRNSA